MRGRQMEMWVWAFGERQECMRKSTIYAASSRTWALTLWTWSEKFVRSLLTIRTQSIVGRNERFANIRSRELQKFRHRVFALQRKICDKNSSNRTSVKSIWFIHFFIHCHAKSANRCPWRAKCTKFEKMFAYEGFRCRSQWIISFRFELNWVNLHGIDKL